MLKRLYLTFLVLFCSLGAGCGSYELRDDVDIDINWAPLVGPSTELHSPYAQGARFNLFVDDRGSSSSVDGSWQLTSDRPDVMLLEPAQIMSYRENGKEHTYLRIPARARGEGATDLVVRDGGGGEVMRVRVEVLRPDRIELLSHGPLLIGHEDEALVREARVQEGGTATFLARYFRGDRALSGNGVLSLVPSEGLKAEVRQSFLFEDRDWLQVTPQRSGPLTVDLLADGFPTGRFTVSGEPAGSVVSLRLRQSERAERGAKDGELLAVLAEGIDGQGRTILGVEPKWDFGGTPQGSMGDLFRYEFKRGMRRLLTATLGAMNSSLMIEAERGYVSSTNHVGCQLVRGHTAQAPASLGPLGLLLLALGLLWRRPRRWLQ